MIERVDHLAIHDVLQLFQVHHEAGAGIHLPFDRDFQGVIVSMAIRVIALAENALVLLRRKLGVVIIVGSGKLCFSCQENHWRFLSSFLQLRICSRVDESGVLSGAVLGYVLPFHLTSPRTLEWSHERTRSTEKSGKPSNDNRLADAAKCARRIPTRNRAQKIGPSQNPAVANG